MRKTYPTTDSLAFDLQMSNLEQLRRNKGIFALGDCVASDVATLVDVKMSHGYSTAITIVSGYVATLANLMGVTPPTDIMARDIAELLYEDAYFLNVFEFSEFFKRLRKGSYGGFFGSIDSLKLIEKFHQFMAERNAQIQKLQREAQINREVLAVEQGKKNGVPMPDSLRNYISELGSSFDVGSLLNTRSKSSAKLKNCNCPECGELAYCNDSGAIGCCNCGYMN